MAASGEHSTRDFRDPVVDNTTPLPPQNLKTIFPLWRVARSISLISFYCRAAPLLSVCTFAPGAVVRFSILPRTRTNNARHTHEPLVRRIYVFRIGIATQIFTRRLPSGVAVQARGCALESRPLPRARAERAKIRRVN